MSIQTPSRFHKTFADPVMRVLFLSVLLLSLGACVMRFPPATSTPTAFPVPTPLPDVPLPNWRGVTVSQTTEEEVISLVGSPAKIIPSWRGPTFPSRYGMTYYEYPYNYEPPYTGLSAAIFFRDGVVQYIDPGWILGKGASPAEWPVHLSDLIAQYGEPEKVTWDEFLYSRTYIFARHGVIAIADCPTKLEDAGNIRVFKIEYFTPMSLDTYLRTWGSDLPQSGSREDWAPEDCYHVEWYDKVP